MVAYTHEEAEQKLNQLERMINDGSQSVANMGICIEWEYRPRYAGGYFRRKKAWGVAKYLDVLTGREIDRDKALALLEQPFEERKQSADLSKIKYCAMCGEVGIGEKELETWGYLNHFTGWRIYRNKETGKETWRYPVHERKPVCSKCCRQILKK